MKKLFLLFAGVFCAQAVFAASTTTKNTMKMVAYFPVPYVAYDTVSATQTMDVGILNECRMSLGENQSNLGGSNCSLYLYGAADGTDDARRGLLNVSAGKLNLNATGFTSTPIIRSSKVLVGSGDTAGYGLLEIGKPDGKDPDFNALYISSLANSGDSVRATGRGNSVTDMAAKVTEFKMFDEIANNFPSCGGTVTWQELELGGDVANNKTYKDVYLVCNDGKEIPPDPFTGCSVCSAYDVDSTEYENCVLNNVSSCCSYADRIYTKRGQDAFEMMKNTSCYDCERQNGTGQLHYSFNTNSTDLVYYAGARVWDGERSYGDTLIGDGGTAVGAQPLNCATYIPKGQSTPFYPLKEGISSSWKPLDVCPDDGTCGGKDSCIHKCNISQCFYTSESDIQCSFLAVQRLCKTKCNKKGWW